MFNSSRTLSSLLSDNLLAKTEPRSLARLLPRIIEQEFPSGTTIYRINDKATYFYLLLDGKVRLTSPKGRDVELLYRRFGEEAGSDTDRYLTHAVTTSTVRVLAIPSNALKALLETNPFLKTDLLLSLGSHLSGEKLERRATLSVASPATIKAKKVGGWLLALVLPVLLLTFGAHLHLARSNVIFLAIFSTTVTMWVFSLVDDYIPGLFALLATLVTGIVPASVVLSGFASDGFLMALSTLALSTVVVTSGLSYRIMLSLLRRLPNTQFWHNFGLHTLGIVLTPLIPTANGRMALISPFYSDLIDYLQFKPKGSAATRLAVSSFGGVSLLSAVFLTSKSVNFAVFGLLPPQEQAHYQWLVWFGTAFVAGFVLLCMNALAAFAWFRNTEQPRLSKERLDEQISLLGKLNRREWAAIIGATFLFLTLATSSIHKLQPPWLGFAMMFGLLLCGTLDKEELKEKVDWVFLLYLSGITGLVAAFNLLGLDKELGNALPGLGLAIRQHFGIFVLLLFIVINLIRLAVPINATIAILATILMPMAEFSGINAWVVGFIILVFAETWFLPYQCSYYSQLQEKRDCYNERSFLRFNAVMNVTRLIAVYASIPFWRMLGIL